MNDCLSEKYVFIDGQRFRAGDEGRKRICQGEYPLLERALYEWHQRLQAKRVPMNGDLIKAAAASLWQKIPDLQQQ